jgi:hypothetical protein
MAICDRGAELVATLSLSAAIAPCAAAGAGEPRIRTTAAQAAGMLRLRAVGMEAPGVGGSG